MAVTPLVTRGGPTTEALSWPFLRFASSGGGLQMKRALLATPAAEDRLQGNSNCLYVYLLLYCTINSTSELLGHSGI